MVKKDLMKPTLDISTNVTDFRSLYCYLIIQHKAQLAERGITTLPHFVELFPPKVGEVLSLVGHQLPVGNVQLSTK